MALSASLSFSREGLLELLSRRSSFTVSKWRFFQTSVYVFDDLCRWRRCRRLIPFNLSVGKPQIMRPSARSMRESANPSSLPRFERAFLTTTRLIISILCASTTTSIYASRDSFDCLVNTFSIDLCQRLRATSQPARGGNSSP
jgi:hypothetical protein